MGYWLILEITSCSQQIRNIIVELVVEVFSEHQSRKVGVLGRVDGSQACSEFVKHD